MDTKNEYIYFTTSDELIKLPVDFSKVQSGTYGSYTIDTSNSVQQTLATALANGTDIELASATPAWSTRSGTVDSSSATVSEQSLAKTSLVNF